MSNELPLNVYKKLLEVKKRVPYLKKDKAGFNYTYVTPSAVFATINPILNELGLILVTNVIDSKSYELQPVIGKDGKAKAPEWKFDLNFIFDWIDTETGEKLSIPWSASGCNGEDKGLGSALTYAERYFILKQFNIPTDNDDPDAFQEKHLTSDEKAERKTEQEKQVASEKKIAADKLKAGIAAAEQTLRNAANFADLASAFTALSPELKNATVKLKDELKAKLKPEPAA